MLTVQILHVYGYADPNDWSDPIPTDQPGQWMAILTKTLLMESYPSGIRVRHRAA